MPCINTTLITIHNASVMELVDMTDSKSVASDSVAVQVRPLVPSLLLEVDTETDLRVGFFVSVKSLSSVINSIIKSYLKSRKTNYFYLCQLSSLHLHKLPVLMRSHHSLTY